MHTGKGQVVELVLESGFRLAQISCQVNLIPSPGQYLLAGIASQSDLLPVSLFSTESTPGGFTSSSSVPVTWTPGTEITLRGPLGHGFELPVTARKVALIPFDTSSSRLRSLIKPALKQGAAVVLVSNMDEERLPDEVEVQPFSALDEVFDWADYIAFDVARENLPELKERLGELNQMSVMKEAQVLIHTPASCGGVADCGVCAVNLRSASKLACKDGPVFGLTEI